MKTYMKKILFAALVAVLTIGISVNAEAQRGYSHTVKNTTIVAGDTTTSLNVEGGIVTFEYNVTEVSGTTAGKVYLEGRMFSAWVKLDSISLTDVTTMQTMRTFLTNTTYKDYRVICTNTSSATLTILAGYFRRPGAREPEPEPIPVPLPEPMPVAKVDHQAWKYYQLVKYNHKGREIIVRRSFVI